MKRISCILGGLALILATGNTASAQFRKFPTAPIGPAPLRNGSLFPPPILLRPYPPTPSPHVPNPVFPGPHVPIHDHHLENYIKRYLLKSFPRCLNDVEVHVDPRHRRLDVVVDYD